MVECESPAPEMLTVVLTPFFEKVLRYPGTPTLAEIPLFEIVTRNSFPKDFDLLNLNPILNPYPFGHYGKTKQSALGFPWGINKYRRPTWDGTCKSHSSDFFG